MCSPGEGRSARAGLFAIWAVADKPIRLTGFSFANWDGDAAPDEEHDQPAGARQACVQHVALQWPEMREDLWWRAHA